MKFVKQGWGWNLLCLYSICYILTFIYDSFYDFYCKFVFFSFPGCWQSPGLPWHAACYWKLVWFYARISIPRQARCSWPKGIEFSNELLLMISRKKFNLFLFSVSIQIHFLFSFCFVIYVYFVSMCNLKAPERVLYMQYKTFESSSLDNVDSVIKIYIKNEKWSISNGFEFRFF